MKKISLFAIALVAVATFTSCSKDRTCTCTVTTTSTDPNFVAGQPEQDTQTLTKFSKKDAAEICVSTTDVQTESGYQYTQTVTRTCTLK